MHIELDQVKQELRLSTIVETLCIFVLVFDNYMDLLL